MRKRLSKSLAENMSYKIVALFISLILWLTIIGRRDFVLTKSVDVELLTASGYTVSGQTVDEVKYKVSGPRSALKKFLDSSLSQTLTIDISDHKPGVSSVEIPMNKSDVPLGVKIISVRPSKIKFEIIASKESKSGRSKE